MNGKHIQNLLKVFPKEQVMIIIFDDFIGDTLAVYKKALEFLGAPDDGRTHFPSANESRFWKHPLLPGILDMMKRPWAKFKKLVGVQETGLWALATAR